jgi:hypothetical protein
MDDLYTEDNSPVDPKSKVISEFNLMLLKNLAEGERLTYSDMGHLLMTGALWEDQIATDADYRLRRRDDCCFGYVRSTYVY